MPDVNAPINGGDADEMPSVVTRPLSTTWIGVYGPSLLSGGFGYYLYKHGHPNWGMFFIFTSLSGVMLNMQARGRGFNDWTEWMKQQYDGHMS